MTVWIYEIGEGEYEEAAVVEDGDVVSGDEALVTSAFPDGIPDDEADVARAFTGPATVASTDFEVDWQEAPEWADEEDIQASGGGGLFSDRRSLQSVPDNAVSITDRSEAPEGANVITGPRGGLYYVPGGGGDESGDAGGGYESPNNDAMREFARSVEAPDDAGQASEFQGELFDTLGGEYGLRETIRGPPTSEAGTTKFTLHESLNAWEQGGYWSGSTAPIWAATQEASGRDAEIPIDMDAGEQYTGRDNFVEGVEDALKDMIAFSQEFVRANMEGDTVTVTRGISEELAEQAREAKENGEPLEIDPRAMESWSTDADAAADWGEVVLTRELEPEDVAFYGPAAIPGEFDDQEITALGREPYEVPPDAIELTE